MKATVSYGLLLTGVVLAIIAPLLFFAFFYAMYPSSENIEMIEMFASYTSRLFVVFTLGQLFIFVGSRKLSTRIFALLNVTFFVVQLLLFVTILPNAHGEGPAIIWRFIALILTFAYLGAGIIGLVSACIEIVRRKGKRGTVHGTNGDFSTLCGCSQIVPPECGTPVDTDEGEPG